MIKYVFYQLTPAGQQQMILAEIERLNCERDAIREHLAVLSENECVHGWENSEVQRQFEWELEQVTTQLWEQEKRHLKLMGHTSDGIPF